MSRLAYFVVDLVCVVIFAAIGRASHSENIVVGLARTAWPFLVGALVAWLVVALAHLRAARWWPTFVLVWLVSAWGGLLLRHVSHQGDRWPFPLVATITLGIMLALGRWALGIVGRRRARSQGAVDPA